MSKSSRRELVRRTATRYQRSGWNDKGPILDEFVAATGYSRKHAITLLVHLSPDAQSDASSDADGSRSRPRRYDEPVREALITVWRAANCVCSRRLTPFLPEFVDALERFGHLNLEQDVRERLLGMSVATVDRLLFAERHPQGRGISTTRRGSLLKHQIPVRTFADWNDVEPGFLEGDLVAHCGTSAEGCFLNTLVLTDVATGWTECTALLRRSEVDVSAAIGAVRELLPFPMLGLDTDNGGEFINYEMLRYCQREKVTFTRARTYRKNDQAHVEEKNGSVVRRLVGYDRYEGMEAWRALAELYRVLRLYLNFFQPSMKLISKERTGARVSRKYDRAQTPYQRALSCSSISEEHKVLLRQQYEEADPVVLLRELRRMQDRFWVHAWGKRNDPVRTTALRERITATAASERHAEEGQRSGETDKSTTPPKTADPRFRDGPPGLGGCLSGRDPALRTASALESGVVEDDHERHGRPQPRQYRRTPKPHAPHTWRTRKDPFEEVWSEVKIQLQLDPGQTAKGLLELLHQRYPERYTEGQLRTLQRRVRDWRRQNLYSEGVLREYFRAGDADEQTGALVDSVNEVSAVVIGRV